MAAAISFKVEGLQKVLAQIDTYNQKVQDGIDDVLSGAAEDVVTIAKSLAPVDDNNLRSNINYEDKRFSKTIRSQAEYSAYLEFGTGSHVDVNNFHEGLEGIDLPKYAKEFFVNGKGHINPHPFLFPAIAEVTPKIPGLIEKVLNNTKV